MIISSSGCSSPTAVPAPLTVNRANLTITAVDMTKATGSANPAFNYTPTGLISGDAINVTYITAAMPWSPAGNYDIIPSLYAANNLLGNYNVTVVKGTLTISDVPVILTQPVGLFKKAGDSATFTVQAAGSPTLTYQWKKNGNPITGMTASSYTILSVASGDAANYSVSVNNSVGTATSVNAYLSIGDVLITAQPKSQTAVPNSTVHFSVTAQSTSSLSYQWNKNNAGIYDTLSPDNKISGSTATASPPGRSSSAAIWAKSIMRAVFGCLLYTRRRRPGS